MVTPHQLELFFYVAKYQGISAAARQIPYGIGQPAISGQIIDLERRIGAPLFQRRPFRLTDKGALLYAYVGPFYEGLPALWQSLQGGPVESLSLAADELIGEDFIVALARETARCLPAVVFELRTGSQAKVEACFSEGQSQVVISATSRTIPGMRSEVLVRTKPQLLVARSSGINSPGHFWRQTRIVERLIYPLDAGLLHHTFERGLRGLGVNWRPGMRVDSMGVMMKMVVTGQGVGLGLALPARSHDPAVRAIPLMGFDSIPITVCWKTPAKPLVAAVVATIRETARRLWTGGEPTVSVGSDAL